MDGKRQKQMLTVLGMLAFIANGENYVVNSLLINIAGDLGVGYDVAALSVTSYMFAFGAFTLVFGPLSDRFGKVKVITIAALGTSVFSILDGFAPDMPTLVAFRAMNGAFGAGIFPVMMAIVGQSFDDEHRHQALAKVLGLGFLGAALATTIGGLLSYFGSWRLVYVIYGVAELAISLIMMRILEKDEPMVTKLSFIRAYRVPLTDFRFMRIVLTLLFVGFSVFGSFAYSSKLIQEMTGYSTLAVGLILSLYGVGTMVGSRIAPRFRKKMGSTVYFVVSGIMGFLAAFMMFVGQSIVVVSLGLFFFGVAFVFLQSMLVGTAQDRLPQARGTAMSLTSFNMFIGGAIGTRVNAGIIGVTGTSTIYLVAAILLLLVGLVSTVFAKNPTGSDVRCLENR